MSYRRPSSRLWLARQVPLCVWALVVVVAAVVLLAQGARGAVGIAVVVVAAVLVAGAWSLEFGRYRSWGYAERAEDLVVRRGLLFRRLSVVPYGRMQFIDVTAGPVDRLLGIATVQLHTAAAATDARIPGLLQRDAEELRDRLAQLGEARAAGL